MCIPFHLCCSLQLNVLKRTAVLRDVWCRVGAARTSLGFIATEERKASNLPVGNAAMFTTSRRQISLQSKPRLIIISTTKSSPVTLARNQILAIWWEKRKNSTTHSVRVQRGEVVAWVLRPTSLVRSIVRLKLPLKFPQASIGNYSIK